jgi:hypothetical protein
MILRIEKTKVRPEISVINKLPLRIKLEGMLLNLKG